MLKFLRSLALAALVAVGVFAPGAAALAQTAAVSYPTAVANDAGVGTVAWTQTGQGLASDGALPTTTNFVLVSCTAANPASQGLRFTFGPGLFGGEDADGTSAIPSDATVTGVEAIVEWNESGGTTGSVTDTLAKLVKAGTVAGTSQSTGTALWDSAASNYQARFTTYGGATNLWGTTLTVSDVTNANFGVELQVTGDGVNTVQVAVDTVLLKVYYTTPDLTAVIRSNSAESTRQAPWVYHAHAQASRWHTYAPEQCQVIWELLSFPSGYVPDSGTDPRTGVPVEFQTVGVRHVPGFNFAIPCTVAGTYTVRCTIYSPDMGEVSYADETFTVSADGRTHRYVDGNATGANDGTSKANAWTSIDSAITWANANPTSGWVEEAGGQTYTTSGGQKTFTSLSNFVWSQYQTEIASGLVTKPKHKRTTDGGNSMWTFATAATRVVLWNLEWTSNGTGDTTWGFSFDATATNVASIDCAGSLLRSWNENGSTTSQRQRILHWKPVVADVYRYLVYGGETVRDMVIYRPTVVMRGNNSGEGTVRTPGSPSAPNKASRINVVWAGITSPSASVDQVALRMWMNWVSVYGSNADDMLGYVIGANNSSDELLAAYCHRWHNVRVRPRAASAGTPYRIGGLTSISDVALVNAVSAGDQAIAATISSSYNGGVRRIAILHPWFNYKVASGGDFVINVEDASGSFSGAAKQVRLGNGVFLSRNPDQNYTSRFINHRFNDSAITAADGSVYQLENGGTTTRQNWQLNNSALTLANWNADAVVGTEVHSRLPYPAIDDSVYYALEDYHGNFTVSSGTSTTVFVLDSSASSEDHFYIGGTFVVAGVTGTGLCQSYVGSTRTVTVTSAYSGTPGLGAAVTFSRNFATERAVGKVSAASGAAMDWRGVFRDMTVTDTSPGPTSVETLPSAPATVNGVLSAGSAVITWSPASGASVYRVWRSVDGTGSAASMCLVAEHLAGSSPYTETLAVLPGVTPVFAVSTVDTKYNESALSASEEAEAAFNRTRRRKFSFPRRHRGIKASRHRVEALRS